MALFTNDITRDHVKKRDRLMAHFPLAQSFLVALEGLHEATEGRFHLGTDQNLHLYVDERFLIYIRLEGLTTVRPSLVFSPQPHNDQVKDGAERAPTLLFPKALLHLIEKHQGGSGGWAKRDLAKDHIGIAAGAPQVFFDDLLAEIKTLA